jgi:hypothetical protein
VFGLNAFFNFIPLPPPKGRTGGGLHESPFHQPLSLRGKVL